MGGHGRSRRLMLQRTHAGGRASHPSRGRVFGLNAQVQLQASQIKAPREARRNH